MEALCSSESVFYYQVAAFLTAPKFTKRSSRCLPWIGPAPRRSAWPRMSPRPMSSTTSPRKKPGKPENVLVESARIARGDIKDLAHVKADDIDALIIPGGFGAAKNLSNFAFKRAARVGQSRSPTPDPRNDRSKKAHRRHLHRPRHPDHGPGPGRRTSPSETIRTRPRALETLGATHKKCPVDGIVVDDVNRLVTTPAYMLGPGIKDVAQGIEKLVNQVLSMIT